MNDDGSGLIEARAGMEWNDGGYYARGVSEADPTQEQLPGLVAQALALVNRRLSGGVAGSGLYGSVRAQLSWIEQVLASGAPPDPERVDKLLLGVYAAREFEAADPELADLLFDIEYLFRRYPPDLADEPAPSTSSPPAAVDVPDLEALFVKRLRSAVRQYVIVDVVCVVTAALMVFLAFATHTWIVGQIFFFGFAAVGVGASGWLTWLVVTSGARHRSLVDVLEHQPGRIGCIYLTVTVTYAAGATRRETVDVPEAEHLPRSGILSIVVTLKDPTPAQLRAGTSRETARVMRDEALPLLAWLRAKAPAAEGPPPDLVRG